jgi:hypothetical protein
VQVVADLLELDAAGRLLDRRGRRAAGVLGECDDVTGHERDPMSVSGRTGWSGIR